MGGTAVAAWDKLCFLTTGVVKMRRGQVASFMLQVKTMKEVYLIFHHFATHCYQVSQGNLHPLASLRCKRELIDVVAAFAVYFTARHEQDVPQSVVLESCPCECSSPASVLDACNKHQIISELLSMSSNVFDACKLY